MIRSSSSCSQAAIGFNAYPKQSYKVVALNFPVHIGLRKPQVSHQAEPNPKCVVPNAYLCLSFGVRGFRCGEVVHLAMGCVNAEVSRRYVL